MAANRTRGCTKRSEQDSTENVAPLQQNQPAEQAENEKKHATRNEQRQPQRNKKIAPKLHTKNENSRAANSGTTLQKKSATAPPKTGETDEAQQKRKSESRLRPATENEKKHATGNEQRQPQRNKKIAPKLHTKNENSRPTNSGTTLQKQSATVAPKTGETDAAQRKRKSQSRVLAAKKKPRKYVRRCYVRIPINCHAQWMKMNSLAPAREYKYAMRQALKACKVSENKFSQALFTYKMTRTKEQFLKDCFEAGIGQPQIDYPKRIAFVKKVLQYGSSSDEEDLNSNDSSVDIPEEKTESKQEESKQEVTNAATQTDFHSRCDVAAFLNDILSCIGHLSKQDMLDYLQKLALHLRVKNFVYSIDKAGLDERTRVFTMSKPLEYFLRGLTWLLAHNWDSESPSKCHMMMELIYFHFHRLSCPLLTHIDKSKVEPHPVFNADEPPGWGVFASQDIPKGQRFYAILETDVNCRLVPSGGTWNYDLGDGQALAPTEDAEGSQAKPHIFMMNHCDLGVESNNIKVEVAYREFATSHSQVFVFMCEATKRILKKEELCFDYFGKRDPVKKEKKVRVDVGKVNVDVSLEEYNPVSRGRKKKVSIDKIKVDTKTRTKIVKWTKQNQKEFIANESSSEPWDLRYHNLLWRDVCKVFHPGYFINADIVQRACLHMQTISDGGDNVHIVNSNYVPYLILQDPYKSDTLLAQQQHIKQYIKDYPGHSWTANLNKNKTVFVPINYPTGTHWTCVILWKQDSNYYVRSYNSMKAFSKHDKAIAKVCIQVCAYMDSKYQKLKWKYFEPHDVVEQRSGACRCALHVVARAYQVCNKQHLTRNMNLTVFDEITRFLCSEFLNCTDTLCGDDVVPDQKFS